MLRKFSRLLSVTLQASRTRPAYNYSALSKNSVILSSTACSMITPTYLNDFAKQWEDKDSRIYTDFNIKQYTFLRQSILRFNEGDSEVLLGLLKEFITSQVVVDLFVKNPQNWSIVHDYMSYSIKVEDLHLFIANNLMRAVESAQSRASTKANIKNCLDIAESYNSFFLKRFYAVECKLFIYFK